MTTSAPVRTQTALPDIDDPHTLAGEHARLMRDVQRRATPVLALLETRAWPHAELGTLTNFLRTAVLRQVADEEVRLFPHDSSAPPFAELNADHVRLHSLTAQLEEARTQACSRDRLRALIEALLATLHRHLHEEQTVLAALPTGDSVVPSVAHLAGTSQTWLPSDDAPILIDLDCLPADQASELCIERLLRLQPGQHAEVHSSSDHLLRPIGRWLRDFDAARFGFATNSTSQDHLLSVTCRETQ